MAASIRSAGVEWTASSTSWSIRASSDVSSRKRLEGPARRDVRTRKFYHGESSSFARVRFHPARPATPSPRAFTVP